MFRKSIGPKARPGLSLVILLVVASVSFFTASAAVASGLADSPWPTMNFNAQRTGNSPNRGPGAAVEKWNYRAGGPSQYSSPAVDTSGTIYFGSDDGYVNAVSSKGFFSWRFLTGGAVRSSPTIGTDGTVYVGSASGYLFALNPDGTLKWSVGVKAEVASSPIVADDGTIYIGTTGSGFFGSRFYALNPNGTVKWAKSLSGPVNKAVTLGLDGTIYAGSNTTASPNFYAFNPDGSQKWTVGLAYAPSSAPVAATDTIYLNSGTTTAGSLYAFDSSGAVKWQYSGGAGGGAPAIGSDGTAYYRDMRGNLRAISPAGGLNWSAGISASGSANPIIDPDGTIFVTGGSKAYAFYRSGAQKWSFEMNRGAAVEIYDSMAMGRDGTLYVSDTRGFLYAIGELAPPTNLWADSLGTGVNLQWQQSASPNVAGYYVYRSLTSAGPYSKITSLLGGLSYLDTATSIGTTYYYVVKAAALNATAESVESNEATGTKLDVTPPTTTSWTSPANPNGPSGWFITMPILYLSRNEPGVTYYQWDAVDPDGWTAYSGGMNPPQGSHNLYYYSVDAAGNIEGRRVKTVKVDTKAPSAFSLLSPVNGSSANTKPDLNWLPSADAESGLGKYQLYIDGVLNKDNLDPLLTTTKPSASLSLGLHFWYVMAVDVCGNQIKSDATWIMMVETTPPTTALLISPSAPDAPGGWYKTRPSITLTPNETADTYYQWDSAGWKLYSSSLSGIDGSHTLNYYSVDPAGNTEVKKSYAFKVDVTPPVTTAILPPADGDGGWYKTAPFITLSRDESGTTYYQWDSSATTWTVYSGGFSAPEGPHTLFYRSIDLLGNTETVRSLPVNADTGAPTTPALSGSAPGPTRVDLAWTSATDTVSGVGGYDIYNADTSSVITSTQTVSRTFTGLSPGTSYRYFVKSFDNAGNLSGPSNVVTVLTPPTVNTPAGPGEAAVTVNVNPTVTVAFTDVTVDGMTIVAESASPVSGPPSGFSFRGHELDISTDAGVTPPIIISIGYSEADVSGDEAGLQLFHWEGGQWKNITLYVDTVNNIVVGQTNSLSPFILGGPDPVTGVNQTALLIVAVVLVASGVLLLAHSSDTKKITAEERA